LTPAGKGAYGVVIKACIKAQPHKSVAIKYTASNSDSRAEIDTFRKINGHPHVLRVFSVHYKLKNKLALIVSELGQKDLVDLLNTWNCDDFNNNKPVLDSFACAHMLFQLLSALDYPHNKHHIIHLDIKTDNILVCQKLPSISSYLVKLIDFSHARVADRVKSDPVLLTTAIKNLNVGTVDYQSPEIRSQSIKMEKGYYEKALSNSQRLREKSGDSVVTSRADIFSLGIVFYTMICRHLPFSDCKNSLMDACYLFDEYDMDESTQELLTRAEGIKLDDLNEIKYLKGKPKYDQLFETDDDHLPFRTMKSKSAPKGIMVFFRASLGWNRVSKDTVEIIRQMMSSKPESRPAAEELLKNDYFKTRWKQQLKLQSMAELDKEHTAPYEKTLDAMALRFTLPKIEKKRSVDSGIAIISPSVKRQTWRNGLSVETSSESTLCEGNTESSDTEGPEPVIFESKRKRVKRSNSGKSTVKCKE